MVIDLHWSEFIYIHLAFVLPGFTYAGLLCGAQYSALTHAPAVSALVVQWKSRTLLKDSRAWRGANGSPLCVLHHLVSFPIVSMTWHHLGRTEHFVLAQEVTGIMIAWSEIKVQSKYWNSITYFLPLRKVPFVNYTLFSTFVLDGKTCLPSVVSI